MHPVDLLAGAFRKMEGNLPDMTGMEDGICCISGAFGPTLARKDFIASSFTDRGGMLAPDSDRIGVNAAIALRFAVPVEGKKRPRWPEMNDSWWTDGRAFDVMDRPTARERILHGYNTDVWRPWAAYITTTKKKHGAMRAVINTSERGCWAFDEHLIDCAGDRVNRWYDRMRQAMRDGIGRMSIAEGDMPPALMRRIGLDVWLPFAEWARPRRTAPLYALCVWLLPTQAELKDNEHV